MASPSPQRTATDPLTVQRTQEVSSFHPGTTNISLLSKRYAYYVSRPSQQPKNYISHGGKKRIAKLTTIPTAANCTTATTESSAANTLHPDSRFNRPPATMTRNPTIEASSATAARLIRNPVVRHIEQKYRPPPSHSSSSGKCRHGGSATELQLRCRPTVREKTPPPGVRALYEIQLGVAIEASVIAVAR